MISQQFRRNWLSYMPHLVSELRGYSEVGRGRLTALQAHRVLRLAFLNLSLKVMDELIQTDAGNRNKCTKDIDLNYTS